MALGTTDPAAVAGERRVLAAASAVVTTSTWTRNLLLDMYDLRPEAVHVAPPGVDPAPLAPGTPRGGELLCVAAVAAHKGQIDLVAALELVADLPWSCRLVGALALEPRYVARLRERIARAGLSDRVQMGGALSSAALHRAYAAADLLVLPSHTETYGMVVTESLARGVPVIATRVGGVPEALGDTAGGRPGLLVPPGQPAALARALRAWLTDGALRMRLRGRAAERRRALTPWSRTAEEVSAVLDGVRGVEP
jgi:glycosyltransferase involved in cell wall biosynthesis